MGSIIISRIRKQHQQSELKMKRVIKKLWRNGRNVWEISQLTGVAESKILEVINDRQTPLRKRRNWN